MTRFYRYAHYSFKWLPSDRQIDRATPLERLPLFLMCLSLSLFPLVGVAGEGGPRSVAAVSLFSDIVARDVGDVVTVLVIEQASASKTSNTQTKRSSSRQGDISALPVASHTWVGQHAGLLEQGVQFGGKTSFSGGGSTSRTETLQAEVSALVKEVLPNGNLLIEGHRNITVNGETQVISVKGIVRPADIQANNAILSKYLVNPEISYTGKGILSSQKPGWLSRVLDWIWPF